MTSVSSSNESNHVPHTHTNKSNQALLRMIWPICMSMRDMIGGLFCVGFFAHDLIIELVFFQQIMREKKRALKGPLKSPWYSCECVKSCAKEPDLTYSYAYEGQDVTHLKIIRDSFPQKTHANASNHAQNSPRIQNSFPRKTHVQKDMSSSNHVPHTHPNESDHVQKSPVLQASFPRKPHVQKEPPIESYNELHLTLDCKRLISK